MKLFLIMFLITSSFASHAYSKELVLRIDRGVASYVDDDPENWDENIVAPSIGGEIEFVELTSRDLSGSISYASYADIDRASLKFEVVPGSDFSMDIGLYYYKGEFSDVYENMHYSNDHTGKYNSLQFSVNPTLDLNLTKWLRVRSGLDFQIPIHFSSEGRKCVLVSSSGFYGCGGEYVDAGIEDFTNTALYPWVQAEIELYDFRVGVELEYTMQEELNMDSLILRKSLTVGYRYSL